MTETDLTIPGELLAPLERATTFAQSLDAGDGRLICPEHRVEHTGKSACVAISALELYRHTAKVRWRDLAVAQGRRLVARLEREGSSPCHTFRPGRHDPYNCSNSVIDGGACSDALSSLVLSLGDELSPEDRAAFGQAACLHARTYLRYAVLDKGIPAQRAWGLTGLAGAIALERDPELEEAAIQATGVLEGIQNPDGSYPYHPQEWGAGHPGAADVSAFYQSRVTAFLLFALERIGRDPAKPIFRGPIVRGLDFLRATVGPDGIKPGLLEAKPWYFGAEYEVASHPFDIYALARGAALFARVPDGERALDSLAAWAAHLDEGGAPRTHLPGTGRGRSYQCPLFFAAHACWIARALPDLAQAHQRRHRSVEAIESARGGSIDLEVTYFPAAQLARLEDATVVAFARGSRPAGNLHHGSRFGAGLLRVVARETGQVLLERRPGLVHQAGEWRGRAGRPAPARGFAAGRDELRFSLWLARVEARAGRRARALAKPFQIARKGVLEFASTAVSSGFDREAKLVALADGVRIEGALAHRDGRRVPGSRTLRTFLVEGDGLAVEEQVEAPGVRGLRFSVPAGACDVTQERHRVRYRLVPGRAGTGGAEQESAL